MVDKVDGSHVAAKVMPHSWIGNNHAEFIAKHPTEKEWPWQDVGCIKFLNSVNFAHTCTLLGVYHDSRSKKTAVMTSFSEQGDLFAWSSKCKFPPGPEREEMVRPLMCQLMQGLKEMHKLSIAHRDVSLENSVVSLDSESGALKLSIIDFGMSRVDRMATGTSGKVSYQGPEMHSGLEYDTFLADTFAAGVVLYAMLMMDYPWLSSAPDKCKCFTYVKNHGLRKYVSVRKKGKGQTVGGLLSEPALKLLEGLLCVDPANRLTLGEEGCWEEGRKSVWDESWLLGGVSEQNLPGGISEAKLQL